MKRRSGLIHEHKPVKFVQLQHFAENGQIEKVFKFGKYSSSLKDNLEGAAKDSIHVFEY